MTTCIIAAGTLPQDGLTPLLWAAQHGTPDVVGVLVAAGADKEARDEVSVPVAVHERYQRN